MILQNKSVQQWLDYLEQSHTKEIQLGLTRIASVAQVMDLLKPACPVITVAGTNGKGSTVSALEMFYLSAGYKVGSYTSPHIHRFNERIRINAQPIEDKDLCKAFEIVEQARGTTDLTYFEVATLSALWYFNAHNLDVIILETGLGGRLDATNIIDSTVSIITTIDFDHEDWLGNTLNAIAFEKAGIMREDKPCIYADLNPPDSIIEQANVKNVPLICLESDYQLEISKETFKVIYQEKTWTLPKPHIQLKSAAAALIAIEILHQKLPVNLESMHTAMERIFIPGRLELSENTIPVLLDVSHNPQAARLLAKHLENIPANKVHAVFSALQDKNLQGLIHPLRDCVDHWYPAQLDNKRAASRLLLTQTFHELAINTEGWYEHPLTAFRAAQQKAKEGDVIVVYGSFFTVAAVREHIQQKETQ